MATIDPDSLQGQIIETRQNIDKIGNEVVSLPNDVALGYIPARPQLLRLIKRSMDETETAAVMEALAGQMELSYERARLIRLYEDRMHSLQKTLEGAATALQNARLAIAQNIDDQE